MDNNRAKILLVLIVIVVMILFGCYTYLGSFSESEIGHYINQNIDICEVMAEKTVGNSRVVVFRNEEQAGYAVFNKLLFTQRYKLEQWHMSDYNKESQEAIDQIVIDDGMNLYLTTIKLKEVLPDKTYENKGWFCKSIKIGILLSIAIILIISVLRKFL